MGRVFISLFTSAFLIACSSAPKDEKAHKNLESSDELNHSTEPQAETTEEDGSVSEAISAPVPQEQASATALNPEVGTRLNEIKFYGFPRNGGADIGAEQSVQSLNLFQIGTPKNQLILLHTATLWCSSCKKAAQDLAAESENLEGKGVTVIELLLEGATIGLPPSDLELALWASANGLSAATVKPSAEDEENLFTDREYAYLIDRETNEILWRTQALFTSPSITELAIGAVDEFLRGP